MRCPYCGYKEDKVVDSRGTAEKSAVRRRRECLKCGKRFTTYEYIEEISLMVIKKDGRREIFDADKIKAGVMRAIEKRPVSIHAADEVVNSVVDFIFEKGEKEIPSNMIGEEIMRRLKGLDEVAYVRFASVYRQFRDINDFMSELNSLLTKRS